ncbi:MAG: bifunctional transaldolase/phosoglucose isomerase [Candidatus Eisenbacteria bacterium]
MHPLDPQHFWLPPELATEARHRLEAWDAADGTRRLWARDATLWTGGDEARWLDWLGVIEHQRHAMPQILAFADEVAREGFTHALLLGMGGSSLAPEVMALTLGPIPGHPRLTVLDSTDPSQVRAALGSLDPAHTLVIVSSKSGSTLEPAIFKAAALEHLRATLDAAAGEHFIAITDPNSKLEEEARHDGFSAVFDGIPGIGGRYSALSNFGLVPAAVLGADPARLLDEAAVMRNACRPGPPATHNPGVALGVRLGVLAQAGRDKITLVASPGIADLGAWLEQLLAESTGKHGKALIPVDRERPGSPDVYGKDRVFVYLRLETAADPAQDRAIERLERAHHPVVRIGLTSEYAIAQEFFRWEIATAVAGSVMGIHPFDQPDVEASKDATRTLTTAYETNGALPSEMPLHVGQGIALYADAGNAAALTRGGTPSSLSRWLAAHLGRAGAGDYVALLAYLPMTHANESALQAIRHRVRDARRLATCLGFGPRFLHSTGQAYKGGPPTGVFLQITCDDAHDLPVPGRRYTFGVVKAAQARGDFAVLAERGRRALRVHLGPDVAAGLATLDAAVAEALA